MSGRIDKIQFVLHTVVNMIHLDGMTFNCDASFLFQFHIVEHLVAHFPVANGFCVNQHPVGQCTFPVVDVSNDAKITNLIHIYCFLFYYSEVIF